MLSNAYFIAKFRFDTAENEPAKNLQNFAKSANFADPNPRSPHPGSWRARCRMVAPYLAWGAPPVGPSAGADPQRGPTPMFFLTPN